MPDEITDPGRTDDVSTGISTYLAIAVSLITLLGGIASGIGAALEANSEVVNQDVVVWLGVVAAVATAVSGAVTGWLSHNRGQQAVAQMNYGSGIQFDHELDEAVDLAEDAEIERASRDVPQSSVTIQGGGPALANAEVQPAYDPTLSDK